MTEVPDHLLQRSRERRAALGGGDAGAAAPAEGAAAEGAEPQEAPGRAVEPAAAAPLVVQELPPPPPPPPYVQAALERTKLPVYMPAVGIAALLWMFIYAGILFAPGEQLDPEVELGGEIYAAQCSGCHGGSGQGGTGRPLSGEVLLTFPDRADHIAWVREGSPAAGTPYGDPNRPGGQHASQDGWPAMPGFGGALSDEEINAVVRYEREVLDEEEPSTEGAEGPGAGAGTADDPTAEAETEGGDVSEGETGDEEAEPVEGADETGSTDESE